MVIKRFDPELANRVFLDMGRRELRFIQNFVLNGSTGDNQDGILTDAETVTGTNLFDAVLAAQQVVSDHLYQPTGVVVNSADWFGFLRWMVGPPAMGSGQLGDTVITNTLPNRLAGLPVVVNPAMPAGQVLVGDFTDGVQIWDRQQTRVLISDSHAEFFVRNTVAILAEARMALTIYAPYAFAVGTVGGGGAGGEGVTPGSAPAPQGAPRAQPGQSGTASTPQQMQAQQERRRTGQG